MSEYNPDRWVILQVSSPEHGTFCRLYSGCYGGYAGSDTWKMNSGIAHIAIDGEIIKFTGESGSVYTCHKHCEGMSSYMARVLSHFKTIHPDAKFDVINFNDYFDQWNTPKQS